MMVDTYPPRNEYTGRKRWWRKRRVLFLAVAVLAVLAVGFVVYRASNVLTIVGAADVGTYQNFSVEKEEDRIDVLVMGIRGAGDENGGLLADTMILAILNKRTKKASMVSIPRDLVVEMPDYPQPEKINFAYALGELRSSGGGGLALSKEVVKYISGVYVDYAVVVNFDGFTRAVDILDGVTVSLDEPFYESQQWQGEGNAGTRFWILQEATPSDEETPAIEGENVPTDAEEIPAAAEPQEPQKYWTFYMPAGAYTLNGAEALYYIRSRYSTSDFDRMRRQQQVVDSLKAKVLSLGILGNPLKVYDLFNALGNNIRTDMGLGDIREFVSLAQEYSSVPVRTEVIDASPESLLRGDVSTGRYELLPKSGDLSEMRHFFQTVLD
jgi:polyisoprenyl-teichoic acid--peptidoglycan teichoic acid transferase